MTAALLGAVLVGGLASAAPTASPPPGAVVFSKQVGDDGRALFVGRSDGSGAVRVTLGPNDDRPQWSPNGRQIVFERSVDDDVTSVWIVSADGTGERELDADPYAEHPRWSPDGHRIAYQVQTSERIPDGARAHTTYELWLVRPDGSGRSRLIRSGVGELGDENPVFAVQTGAWAWSPDSRRIAFVRPRRNEDAARGGVWVVDVAMRAAQYVGPGSDVAWSPDGRRLATTTNDRASSATRSAERSGSSPSRQGSAVGSRGLRRSRVTASALVSRRAHDRVPEVRKRVVVMTASSSGHDLQHAARLEQPLIAGQPTARDSSSTSRREEPAGS